MGWGGGGVAGFEGGIVGCVCVGSSDGCSFNDCTMGLAKGIGVIHRVSRA